MYSLCGHTFGLPKQNDVLMYKVRVATLMGIFHVG